MVYRSRFEETIAKSLHDKGVDFEYETLKVSYVSAHKYTPDIIIRNSDGSIKHIIELKGRFTASDRSKHIQIRKQHPDIDIKFVFMNANVKLHKASKTTYSMWAEKHGFTWSNKVIPDEWLS